MQLTFRLLNVFIRGVFAKRDDMDRNRRFVRRSAVCMVLLCCAVYGALPLPAAAASPGLSVADCIKCHKQESAEIDAKGMAHKVELDCQSCHESHRPKVADNIPSCNECHSGKAHYDLLECTGCHNPHTPLDVTLKGDFKDLCKTCHETVYEVLSASQTKHRDLTCITCHEGKHKVVPLCTGCHVQPHTASMLQRFPQCGNCHGKAHNLN